ncbi:hypothetical protein P2318_33105 [Myxococcaceae bacterium GXIMD 01537]
MACRNCGEETPHRLERHYKVAHFFWFPLFSMGTSYLWICGRCGLHSEGVEPAPSTVLPAPLLHRMGCLFLLISPCVVLPLLVMMLSLVSGGSRSGSAEARPREPNYSDLLEARPEDLVVEELLQTEVEDMGLKSMVVEASSAEVNGHVVRVIIMQSDRLKKLGDGDRMRLLERMETLADGSFAKDEVFLGLRGRIAWGGYSHRPSGGKWQRDVDDFTKSPVLEAGKVLRELSLAESEESPDAGTPPAAPVAAEGEATSQ